MIDVEILRLMLGDLMLQNLILQSQTKDNAKQEKAKDDGPDRRPRPD